MKSIESKPLGWFLCRGATLLGLTCCVLSTADARKLSPSEQFPGPWLD
jgi:hypothetical protein